jgi:hypothetical protein
VDLCIGKSPTLPSHSIGSRSHDAVFRVYDDAGNVIETHEQRAISERGNLVVQLAADLRFASLV